MTSGASELLPRGSEFFGHTVARMVGDRLTEKRCEDVLAEAADSGVASLYFLAGPDDPDTMEVAPRVGLQLVVSVELEAAAAAVHLIDAPRPLRFRSRRDNGHRRRVEMSTHNGSINDAAF